MSIWNNGLGKFLSAEMWKKSAALGWFGFILVMLIWSASAVVAMVRGGGAEPINVGTNIVMLITLTLGIGHGGQWVKRSTEWKPEQIARAERIKNGVRIPG